MVRLPRQRSSHSAGIRTGVPVLLCLCAFLGACAELPPASRMQPSSFQPSAADRRPLLIGVLIASWHSGLVLPAGELGPLRPLIFDNPHAGYLSIGWGNRRFYMAPHPTSGDALAALFSSPSALFVQAVSTATQLSTGDAQIHWVCADREELWRVDRYIEASLHLPDGKPVDLGPGPLPESRFYASTEPYSAVHTCNTWTVAALRYAGLPVRAGGVIFADQAAARIRALPTCPLSAEAPRTARDRCCRR